RSPAPRRGGRRGGDRGADAEAAPRRARRAVPGASPGPPAAPPDPVPRRRPRRGRGPVTRGSGGSRRGPLTCGDPLTGRAGSSQTKEITWCHVLRAVPPRRAAPDLLGRGARHLGG